MNIPYLLESKSNNFFYSDCNHKFYKLKCNTVTAEIKFKDLLYLKCGDNLKEKSAE